MPKRSTDNLNEGLVEGLLHLDHDELVAVITEIANQAKIYERHLWTKI